jgi:hypothetical protein
MHRPEFIHVGRTLGDLDGHGKSLAMLSTIVIVPPPEASGRKPPLAPVLRTLSALVPATVEGAVRDVALLVVGDGGEVSAIADEAGCGLIREASFEAAMTRAVAGARAAWICVLQAGALPGRGFAEDVANALGEAGDPPHALLLRSEGGRFGRIFPSLAAVAGVIAPRQRFSGRACASFADLLHHARPARTLLGRVVMVA